MLLFQTVLLLAASTSSPTTFVIDEPTDVILSGGASLTSAPLYSLRSGNPPARTSASIRTVLNPGATIASLSFAYRYDTGFGPTGVGANFTLRAAGQAVYESPHFTDYSYGQNKSNYSQVRKNSLDWVGSLSFPSSFERGRKNRRAFNLCFWVARATKPFQHSDALLFVRMRVKCVHSHSSSSPSQPHPVSIPFSSPPTLC